MFAQERLNAIKKIIRRQKRMNFLDLQKQIKVSSATLRRDLTELERAGDIIRVHGGLMDPSYVRSEISFDERMLRNSDAKRIIADKVMDLIPPSSTVYVDAGSTCLGAGKALMGRKDIRLITHSVGLLAAALTGEAEVLCIGGELRKVSGALVGGAALGMLESVQVDFALIGASGLDEEGCFTTELTEAGMKKTVMERARQKVLLADFTKWRTPNTIRFSEWPNFTHWVLDRKLSQADTKLFRHHRIELR